MGAGNASRRPVASTERGHTMVRRCADRSSRGSVSQSLSQSRCWWWWFSILLLIGCLAGAVYWYEGAGAPASSPQRTTGRSPDDDFVPTQFRSNRVVQ